MNTTCEVLYSSPVATFVKIKWNEQCDNPSLTVLRNDGETGTLPRQHCIVGIMELSVIFLNKKSKFLLE